MSDVLAHARAVLAQEMAGLQALQNWLAEPFARAVEVIAAACDAGSGRLIVSGMGKSGHVARKIAATMASTGTPAHFVHPAEASHGDLGMITARDCVLVLSNSGETQELTDVVGHCKRFRIPLIAMIRRAGSMLATAADVPLVLPDVPEASPTGAPTTSTTMMLALGDALAVALLEKRGFTREHFAHFHPGGRLGRAFVRVRELMHTGKELPITTPDAPMNEVLLTMTAGRFGCAAVVENGRLVGVITDGDLRRHMGPSLLSATARGLMTGSPATIMEDALAEEAVQRMNARGITCLPVVDDAGCLRGMLHIHDCLRAGIA